MKKILLMGSEGAGKTSMHSVIFANHSGKSTKQLGYTSGKKEHQLDFMGNLKFNLWDCGGQDTFMDNYFMVQRETIFKNVEIVIYVFDVDESEEKRKKSLSYWQRAVNCVEQYNENGLIFVLLHKIDKIPLDNRIKVLQEQTDQINSMVESNKVKVRDFYNTSIWDESLYQAWSRIVQQLIPNKALISHTLQKLCLASDCQEACLFQKSTFLTLGYHHKEVQKDILKYEKVANIVKQFRLTCKKYNRNINELSLNSSTFNILIAEFTSSENILIVYNNVKSKVCAQINISNMGKIFEEEKNKVST